jgi:hypothetical protein
LEAPLRNELFGLVGQAHLCRDSLDTTPLPEGTQSLTRIFVQTPSPKPTRTRDRLLKPRSTSIFASSVCPPTTPLSRDSSGLHHEPGAVSQGRRLIRYVNRA